MAEYARTDATGTAAVVVDVGVKRISWAAIIAGVMIALVSQIVLGMLGTAIGMSTIDPLEGESPGLKTFSIAAGLWWTVSSWISLFFGGWVAGHVSAVAEEMDAILHGLLTWALGTVVALFVAGSVIGGIVSGVSGMAGNSVLVASSAAGAQTQGGPPPQGSRVAGSDPAAAWAEIKREAQAIFQAKPAQQPAAADQKGAPAADSKGTAPDSKGAAPDSKGTAPDSKGAAPDSKGAAPGSGPAPTLSDSGFDTAIDRLLNRGRDSASSADRDAVVNGVMARGGLTREDAAKRVEIWENSAQQSRTQSEQQRQQARQKAKEMGDATAKAVSRAALFGFVALLLGGVAAAVGGALGRPQNNLRTTSTNRL